MERTKERETTIEDIKKKLLKIKDRSSDAKRLTMLSSCVAAIITSENESPYVDTIESKRRESWLGII